MAGETTATTTATKAKTGESSKNGAELSQADIDALKAQLAKAGEGLSDRSEDVSGYWVPEASAIHCVPMSAKLFDSGIDPTKPSALVMVRLEGPTVVEDADSESKRIAKKGEIIGIWYKPGMRAIASCAGVVALMTLQPEAKWKDTGKGNKMKTFSVKAGDGGSKIPVSSDSRAKSKGAPTVFDVQQAAKAHGPETEEAPF